MNAQDVIGGSRLIHVRELQTALEAAKAANTVLREENAMLAAHFDFALLAAADLSDLGEDGRLVIIDGWNLILGATREARDREDLLARARSRLAERPQDRVWIVYDGARPSTRVEEGGHLRITYTGGSGSHRADRFICDFLRMAQLRGEVSKIEVRTADRDFRREVERLGAAVRPPQRRQADGTARPYDRYFMEMALGEARLAAEEGEVPTGCVIVEEPADPTAPPASIRILARAHNRAESIRDSTAHAEMLALAQAFAAKGDWRLAGTRLYVTKEPCPMCAGAIILARVAAVIWGVSDPKRGGGTVFGIFSHPGINHHPEIGTGVLETESKAVLQEFFQRRRD